MTEPAATVDAPAAAKMTAHEVSVLHGARIAVRNVSFRIDAHTVTALIGPSGSGKSALLWCLNRMNDTVADCRVTGRVTLDGRDIYADDVDVAALRRRVGMIFDRPALFPATIFDNVAFPLRIAGERGASALREGVERALDRARLLDLFKDKLETPALALPEGEQQRLCIARTLAARPEVILMDDPTGDLDPIATARIEELIHELRTTHTIVFVTHSMQQAARVSDFTGYFDHGELVELGPTSRLFTRPAERRTEEYITGRFG